MRTIIWTIGKAAQHLVADFERAVPTTTKGQKSASTPPDVSLVKIVVNIVRTSGR